MLHSQGYTKPRVRTPPYLLLSEGNYKRTIRYREWLASQSPQSRHPKIKPYKFSSARGNLSSDGAEKLSSSPGLVCSICLLQLERDLL